MTSRRPWNISVYVSSFALGETPTSWGRIKSLDAGASLTGRAMDVALFGNRLTKAPENRAEDLASCKTFIALGDEPLGKGFGWIDTEIESMNRKNAA